jgi:hypothetical protein
MIVNCKVLDRSEGFISVGAILRFVKRDSKWVPPE